ncbi:MAG: hypothetical protein K2L51_06555 [Clostridiales bacterium]|nr:hypothetical protein [Clostridiales bacterium]
MEIEIAAILTIAGKLELLEELLDKRMARAALDTVSPALPLLQKVYALGEYKRLAANLAVMEHRLRCALREEECESIMRAAKRFCGLRLSGRAVKPALKKARQILTTLGVFASDLEAYKKLPLYRSECMRIARAQRLAGRKEQSEGAPPCAQAPQAELPLFIGRGHGGEYAYCRGGRTAQA